METSRSLTSHNRDIVAQLVDDDPRKAELVLELLVVTDSETASGAAARDDLERYAYSLTSDSIRSRENFVRRLLSGLTVVTSVVSLVTFSLNLIC